MNLINMIVIIYYVINNFSRKFNSLEKRIAEKTGELEAANEVLKEMSLCDSLTGLRNRRYISEFVVEYVNNFLKSKLLILRNIMDKRNLAINDKVIGIMMLDIDHFKIKNSIRTDDIVIRWGGEEFLIILNKTIPEYIPVLAKKILMVFREEKVVFNNNTEGVVTCSIGSTIFPVNNSCPDLISFDSCIAYSDMALYHSKQNGRNKATHLELNNAMLSDYDIDHLKLNLSQYKLAVNDPIFITAIID
jgi:diguanylate cyclase (GGDEF)-like protein